MAAAASVAMALAFAACGGGGAVDPDVQRLPSQFRGEDVLAFCESLSELHGYRFTVSFDIQSPQPQGPVDEELVGDPPFALAPTSPDFAISQAYEGAVVNPDRLEYELGQGSAALTVRVIGAQEWISAGGGAWAASTSPRQFGFDPQSVCTAIATGLELIDAEVSDDEVEGRGRLRFSAEDVDVPVASNLLAFGPGSDMGRLLNRFDVDVWTTEDLVPVQLRARGEGQYPSGRTMSMELLLTLRDLNDRSIEIEPPG